MRSKMSFSTPIQTAEEYIQALKYGQVREVSSNLFLNFPDASVGFLYPENYTLGWIGTSDNLFQLLVLNQRYPSKSKPREGGFQVSAEAFAGLFRAIGFGAFADPSFGSFNVYERNSTPETIPTTSTGIRKPYASNIQFPVFSGFDQTFEKDLFLYSGLTRDRAGQISNDLQNIWSSMRQDIFADSWQQGPTGSMFLQYIGAKPGIKLSVQQAHNLASITPDNTSTGIDRFRFNTADLFVNDILGIKGNPDDFFKPDGRKTYAWWRKLANDYGTLLFADQPQSVFFQGQTPTGAQSFSSLIQELSDQYAAAPLSQYKKFGSIESVLQATLRFYVLFNYQATPLNTQNSLPYSDSANPFVPGSFEELNDLEFNSKVNAPYSWREIYGPTWLDTFSGNEVWVDNLKVDSLVSKPIFGADDKKSQKVYAGKNNVYDNGWVSSSEVEFVKVTKETDGQFKGEFKTIYYQEEDASKRTRAVRFSENSNSSDVFSASAVKDDLKDLNAKTRIGRTGQRIGDIGGLVHSDKILPSEFKTYTFLGGGVDRITGSDFADVIVGTTRQKDGTITAGSLTVYAGDGDDVVAPGRGAGIISLGEGSDQLVIDKSDTFGRTTLFDFSFAEDELILHKKLSASIDVNNDQFLYVFREKDGLISEYKTLHLTQSSGAVTDQGLQTGWSDYFDQFATPELQEALIPQPPGLL